MTVTARAYEEALNLLEDSEHARVFFAPGRANLAGAHMDYNGGRVMPVALSRGTYLAVSPRQDGRFLIQSAQFPGEAVELSPDDLRPGRVKSWSVYTEGALYVARRAWGELPGLNLALSADLPMAKGLSSSASVEAVVVYALSHLMGLNNGASHPDQIDEWVRLAHAAENEYAGVRCGILDQSAIFLAQPDSLLWFDCLELTREHLPLDAAQASIVILDTGVSRQLARSAFNERVAECTQALGLLQKHLPGITCLRDVFPADFAKFGGELTSTLHKRVRHVVTEVVRTDLAADALRRHDLAAFGATMTASHESMRVAYEVSISELDAMVAAAVAQNGCYGARLTGAGFGGCVVALVHPDAREAFDTNVAAAYRVATGREVKPQWFAPAGGPREIVANLRGPSV